MKAVSSFTYGVPMHAQVTSNQSWKINGDQDYTCELVDGDYIFMINFQGMRQEVMFTRIEDNAIVDENGNFYNLNSLVFLGRLE